MQNKYSKLLLRKKKLLRTRCDKKWEIFLHNSLFFTRKVLRKVSIVKRNLHLSFLNEHFYSFVLSRTQISFQLFLGFQTKHKPKKNLGVLKGIFISAYGAVYVRNQSFLSFVNVEIYYNAGKNYTLKRKYNVVSFAAKQKAHFETWFNLFDLPTWFYTNFTFFLIDIYIL